MTQIQHQSLLVPDGVGVARISGYLQRYLLLSSTEYADSKLFRIKLGLKKFQIYACFWPIIKQWRYLSISLAS